MVSSEQSANRWLHRVAGATLVLALLPVASGAVVTTVEAGMAFLDWPSSDGQSLLAYPWLKSSGDKFAEHGHRLAGMLVGVMSLVMCAVAMVTRAQGAAWRLTLSVLLMVISQGLLGGLRVLLNDDAVAMAHGFFGALTVGMLACLVLATGHAWQTASDREMTLPSASRVGFISVSLLLVVLLQFLLGGLLRHLHSASAFVLHPWFAAVVLGFSLWTFSETEGSRSKWMAWGGRWVLLVTFVQLAIGLAAWVVTYGVPWLEIVALQQSTAQTAIRSLHTMTGIALVAVSMSCVARWLRVTPTVWRSRGVPRFGSSLVDTAAAPAPTASGGVR